MNVSQTRGIATLSMIISCVSYGRIRLYDEVTIFFKVVLVTVVIVDAVAVLIVD